ncbi:ABC transporter permease, partial [Algoriphagus aestuarii]|nr:ABC transporter permease [Algoriphagus aestuarii]
GPLRKYFGRKIFVYALTFFAAVTINWMIPRLMPGDPIKSRLARASLNDAGAAEALYGYFNKMFGLDLPLWQQYLNFWVSLFQGDLGISIWNFPTPVIDLILGAVPYSLGLLLPSIILSWLVGNWFGAYAARSKWLDNTILPIGYILTATPYMWLALLLAWS